MSVAVPGPGLLLVLSAPSGAGKTTLAHRLKARQPDACFSISATTRAPRGQERDGVDYHFVSRAHFDDLVARGALAEWAEVHGNRYGTLASTVEQALAAGRIALFDIDVQGGEQIQARWPRQSVTVLVLPPSLAELGRRLRGRGTESDEQVARRLAVAREEISRGARHYRYLLVNDVLEQAEAALAAIVAHERALLGGRADPEAQAVADRHRRERIDLAPWLGKAG